MTTYRHTAHTNSGTFRMDSTVQYPLAVVYVGWRELPEDTKRRLENGEGIMYGWARNEQHARRLVLEAHDEGCVNINVFSVDIRELP
jgi:hypothetical protein